MYAVHYRRSAQKEIKKLPPIVRRMVMQKIEQLAKDPRPSTSVKLRGYDELHRARVGEYRIVYEVQDQQLIIIIVSTQHRSEVYKNL